MFSFLKKKLDEGIKKITESAKAEEEVHVKPAKEKAEKKPKDEKSEKKKEMPEPEEAIKTEKRKESPEKPEEKKEGVFERLKKKAAGVVVLKEEDIAPILEEFDMSLLESDVAYEAAQKIADGLKAELSGKEIKRSELESVIRESLEKTLLEIMDMKKPDMVKMASQKKPFLILLLGFNGAGKTMSAGKLGKFLSDRGLKCVFAAGDTFRAAAIDQIEEHGNNIGIRTIKHPYGSDSAAVIYDAMEYAKKHDIDVVIADTAGRSHSNANLMDELRKIVRVNKPDMKILVLDSLAGNDIFDQCESFSSAAGVDALIMTKADVYDKGGAALSASFATGKPVLFLGVGQGYDDLKEFRAKKIVKGLLG